MRVHLPARSRLCIGCAPTKLHSVLTYPWIHDYLVYKFPRCARRRVEDPEIMREMDRTGESEDRVGRTDVGKHKCPEPGRLRQR